MRNPLIFSLLLAGFAITSAEAATVEKVVVDRASCSQVANTTKPFILVLNPGDKLHDAISQCAKDAKLMGASVSGLGQVHNPTLAYFSSDPKAKPTLTTFSGYYELASLNGNVAANHGQYYTHIHAVLADKKFHGIAGHVDHAEVGLTAEITIVPFSAPVERTLDEKTGFGPLIVLK